MDGCLVAWFVLLFLCSFVHSFVPPLVRSFLRSFVDSVICPFVRPFGHSVSLSLVVSSSRFFRSHARLFGRSSMYCQFENIL